MTLRNLNPDVTTHISETIGRKGDSAASGFGSFSLISLIKQGISLLTISSKVQQSRVTLLPGTPEVLSIANMKTREVVIYNIGIASASICLGTELASEDKKSYSLAPRVLVAESFAGTISAISEQTTEVIVTVKS